MIAAVVIYNFYRWYPKGKIISWRRLSLSSLNRSTRASRSRGFLEMKLSSLPAPQVPLREKVFGKRSEVGSFSPFPNVYFL